MQSAVTLATWLIIFGSWFVIAFALAILIGTIMSRNEPQIIWEPPEPMAEITYWLEDQPDWQFPTRPRPYDQERG